MIFAGGTILPQEALPALLDTLEERLDETRSGPPLELDIVLDALDSLGRDLEDGALDPLLAQYVTPGTRRELLQVQGMLRREVLEERLQLELGDLRPGVWMERSFGRTLVQPLGVLFHVTPGNQPGIPLFSALEGLLTGNINLVKLPHGDRGLSLAALKLLTDREPRLAPWLYAFEVPSTDTSTLERLSALADGAVVWGGDGAVSALRKLAPPGCRLIEWGHRLSFAYVAGYEDQALELSALARHIVGTGGLLCSSCQVIYLDTEQLSHGEAFCTAFLPYLNQAARERDRDGAAQAALYTHTYRLEQLAYRPQEHVWLGEGCSLTLKGDRELELSPLYGNVLVKCLPRAQLLPVLGRQRGRLQTAGLLCRREERAELTTLLARAGVTRITRAGEMSRTFPGEAHDGVYALGRYLRLVDTEA